MSDADFATFMRSVDADGSGQINYREFLARYGEAIAGARYDDGQERFFRAAHGAAALGEAKAFADPRPLPRWDYETVMSALRAKLASKTTKARAALPRVLSSIRV